MSSDPKSNPHIETVTRSSPKDIPITDSHHSTTDTSTTTTTAGEELPPPRPTQPRRANSTTRRPSATNNSMQQFVTHLNWFGSQVFQTIEYIGEGVVSVLGLDESRYQDVLDNMTETELQHAQQVHEEREAENRLHQLTLEARRDTIGGDVESASVVEVVPVVEMTTVVQSSPQVEVEVEDMEERKEKETNTEEGGGGSEDVVVSESDVVIVPHVV